MRAAVILLGVATALAAGALAATVGAGPQGLGVGATALLALAVGMLSALTWRLRRALAGERETNARLQRANLALERFTALVSHDLREPLAAVAISSERLAADLRDRLDDGERELLSYVISGTEEMRGLVEGMLAAARGRDGASGERTVVSCAGLAQQAVAALGPRILERGASVQIGPLPAVEGDAAALRSVFQNLLSNALKFVPPERTPRVHVHADRRPAAWRFTVEDNGVGVDPAEAEGVFAMLARGSGAAGFPGTGLGLASCRSVVERHGGRIWIEPAPGGGTRVAFTLPAPPESSGAAAAAAAPQAAGAASSSMPRWA